GGQDAHHRAGARRQSQVAHRAVDLHGHRSLGQARADRGGRIQAGGAVREIERTAVGKRHLHRARSICAGTLVPMTALTAALAVALVFAVVVLVRLRRERARTLEALRAAGAAAETITRALRESAPRADLSEARAWRDAV